MSCPTWSELNSLIAWTSVYSAPNTLSPAILYVLDNDKSIKVGSPWAWAFPTQPSNMQQSKATVLIPLINSVGFVGAHQIGVPGVENHEWHRKNALF